MLRSAIKWQDDRVVGEHVRYESTGPDWTTCGSGIYIGVALDEESGLPYHYFVDGEIGGLAQTCHGFPAEPRTPVTTDLTPTELIHQQQRGSR